MIRELTISKHSLFKCSNILKAGVLMRKMKGGGAGTHFKNEPLKYLMLVSMIFWRAINSFPFVATNWIQNKMVVQIETSTL